MGNSTPTAEQVIDAWIERGVKVFDEFVWLKHLNPTLSEDSLMEMATVNVDSEAGRIRKMREQREAGRRGQ